MILQAASQIFADISRIRLLEGRRLCQKMWGYLTVAHSQKLGRSFCASDLVRGRTVCQTRAVGALGETHRGGGCLDSNTLAHV